MPRGVCTLPYDTSWKDTVGEPGKENVENKTRGFGRTLSYPQESEERSGQPIPKTFSLEPKDCYTIGEVGDKYRLDDSSVYKHIRKYSIPMRQMGNNVYVPKKEIDNLYKSIKK